MNVGETLYLKMFIRRLNATKQGIPVDKPCDKHMKEFGVQHYIIPAAGEEITRRYYNDYDNLGSSCLYYQSLSPIAHDGTLSESVAIRFPCKDSCQNSSKEHIKEDARDAAMVVQLEKRTVEDIRTVLHEFKIPTWLRAKVDAETLARTTRRKPKGAAAQLNAKKRKAEDSVIKTEPGQDELEAWFQHGKRLIRDGRLTREEVLVKLWGKV